MKLLKNNQKRISLALLTALVFFLFSALILTGCGTAAGKTKKKKIDKTEDEPEATEVKKEETNSNANTKEEPETPEANKSEGNSASPEKKDVEKNDAEKVGIEAKEADEKTVEKKGVEKKNTEKKGVEKKLPEPKDTASKTPKKETEKKSDTKTDKHSAEATKEKTPSGNEIWADLMRGNKLFMKGKYNAGNLLAERSVLAKGQKPQVIVLGCADSRVPPELIFGKNTGDLFVVRDAGNIVDEIALGSIEYAIEHLHSKVLVILGHESCGAVAATVSGEKMPTPNLQSIVDKIAPAFAGSEKCAIGGKMNLSCVELNVNQTAKNILSKSSLIKKATEEGFTIIKAVYRLETGEVIRLN